MSLLPTKVSQSPAIWRVCESACNLATPRDQLYSGKAPYSRHSDQELNIQKHSWHNDGDQSECEGGEVTASPSLIAAPGRQAGECYVIERVPSNKHTLRSRRAVSVTALPSRSYPRPPPPAFVPLCCHYCSALRHSSVPALPCTAPTPLAEWQMPESRHTGQEADKGLFANPTAALPRLCAAPTACTVPLSCHLACPTVQS